MGNAGGQPPPSHHGDVKGEAYRLRVYQEGKGSGKDRSRDLTSQEVKEKVDMMVTRAGHVLAHLSREGGTWSSQEDGEVFEESIRTGLCSKAVAYALCEEGVLTVGRAETRGDVGLVFWESSRMGHSDVGEELWDFFSAYLATDAYPADREGRGARKVVPVAWLSEEAIKERRETLVTIMVTTDSGTGAHHAALKEVARLANAEVGSLNCRFQGHSIPAGATRIFITLAGNAARIWGDDDGGTLLIRSNRGVDRRFAWRRVANKYEMKQQENRGGAKAPSEPVAQQQRPQAPQGQHRNKGGAWTVVGSKGTHTGAVRDQHHVPESTKGTHTGVVKDQRHVPKATRGAEEKGATKGTNVPPWGFVAKSNGSMAKSTRSGAVEPKGELNGLQEAEVALQKLIDANPGLSLLAWLLLLVKCSGGEGMGESMEGKVKGVHLASDLERGVRKGEEPETSPQEHVATNSANQGAKKPQQGGKKTKQVNPESAKEGPITGGNGPKETAHGAEAPQQGGKESRQGEPGPVGEPIVKEHEETGQGAKRPQEELKRTKLGGPGQEEELIVKGPTQEVNQVQQEPVELSKPGEPAGPKDPDAEGTTVGMDIDSDEPGSGGMGGNASLDESSASASFSLRRLRSPGHEASMTDPRLQAGELDSSCESPVGGLHDDSGSVDQPEGGDDREEVDYMAAGIGASRTLDEQTLLDWADIVSLCQDQQGVTKGPLEPENRGATEQSPPGNVF